MREEMLVLVPTSGGIHAPSVARSIAITTPWSPISLLRSAACRRNVPGVPMSPTRSRILDHSSSLLAIVSPFQRSSLVHNRVLHNPVFHSRQFVYADSHVHDAGDGSTDPGPVRQATTKQHLREAGGPNWLQPAQAMGDVTGQVPQRVRQVRPVCSREPVSTTWLGTYRMILRRRRGGASQSASWPDGRQSPYVRKPAREIRRGWPFQSCLYMQLEPCDDQATPNASSRARPWPNSALRPRHRHRGRILRA